MKKIYVNIQNEYSSKKLKRRLGAKEIKIKKGGTLRAPRRHRHATSRPDAWSPAQPENEYRERLQYIQLPGYHPARQNIQFKERERERERERGGGGVSSSPPLSLYSIVFNPSQVEYSQPLPSRTRILKVEQSPKPQISSSPPLSLYSIVFKTLNPSQVELPPSRSNPPSPNRFELGKADCNSHNHVYKNKQRHHQARHTSTRLEPVPNHEPQTRPNIQPPDRPEHAGAAQEDPKQYPFDQQQWLRIITS